ncbi:hypothetical protein ASZ90_000448 [hydrocarbon metagenome]|uniref:Uncharacterized protein n=1 Tax=hydrocarbon metagenome TaxID=938273 RepID=A0A0W8G935_9ZZZZ
MSPETPDGRIACASFFIPRAAFLPPPGRADPDFPPGHAR